MIMSKIGKSGKHGQTEESLTETLLDTIAVKQIYAQKDRYYKS